MLGLSTFEKKIQGGWRFTCRGLEAGESIKSQNQEEREAIELLDIYTMTQRAQQDWENACAFFNEVAETAMVDQAVHGVIAAEHKYDYFIKLAKRENLRNGGVPHDA